MTSLLPSGEPRDHIRGSCGDVIGLPDGFSFEGADFSRDGVNLRISGANGMNILIREFFCAEIPPRLQTQEGDTLSGDLARILVKLSERAVSILLTNANRKEAEQRVQN